MSSLLGRGVSHGVSNEPVAGDSSSISSEHAFSLLDLSPSKGPEMDAQLFRTPSPFVIVTLESLQHGSFPITGVIYAVSQHSSQWYLEALVSSMI